MIKMIVTFEKPIPVKDLDNLQSAIKHFGGEGFFICAGTEPIDNGPRIYLEDAVKNP